MFGDSTLLDAHKAAHSCALLHPSLKMKLFPVVTLLACAAVSVLGQTVGIGYPTNGAVLHRGKQFTAKVIAYVSTRGPSHDTFVDSRRGTQQSPISRYEVGIALTLANCPNDVCPQPNQGLGSVLYTGAFEPTAHCSDGFYEEFVVKVPDYISAGPAVFTLTHLCLIGVCRFPVCHRLAC